MGMVRTDEAAIRYAAFVFASEANALVSHPRIKLPEFFPYLNENYEGILHVPSSGGNGIQRR